MTILLRRRPGILAAGAMLLAQSGLATAAQAQTASKPPQAQAEHEEIIVTKSRAHESKMRQAIERVVGKIKARKLEMSDSEVLSVPKAKAEALKKRLEKAGAKVTRLRENWNHLLHRPQSKEEAKLDAAQQQVVDKVAKAPEVVNVGVLRMGDAAAAELAMTRLEQSVGTKGAAGPAEDRYAKVILPLDEKRHITLVRTRPPVAAERGFTWSGEVEETGERAVLMLWKDGHLSGYFGYKGRVFVVSHMGGEVHTMAEMDPTKLPPDHAPGSKPSRDTPAASEAPAALPTPPPEPAVPPFPDAERQALEAKQIVIDVMLLYTLNAGKNYVRDPHDLLVLAIEQANETFRNSGLGNVSLRLVHEQAVDYDETGSGTNQFDHLYRMVDGEGAFKDIKKLRNEKRADVVGLIIDSPTGCGQATRVGAEADEAYFVVHHSCAAITYSIAHEVGHIIGARHDRTVDPNNQPFPFAHGYVNGTKWRDMMSYREACGGCPRIPFWSNPRVMYKGEPTGTAASDNARIILQEAERVAKFR